METIGYQTHIEIIVCAILVSIIIKIFDSRRPRRVWIVEDSDTDTMLLKMNIEAPDVAITYISTAHDFSYRILRPWKYPKPDQVIADYHLTDAVKGTQIVNLCENNNIDCLLITSDDKVILGIDDKKIIRKSPEKEFYNTLSNWILTKRVSHG